MLVAAGIPERSLMLGRDGLVVGRTQANRVQEVIGEMLAQASAEQPAAQALESEQTQQPAVDNTASQAMNSVAPTESVQAVDNIERILGQQTTRPDIDQAAHAAATSPLNDLPQPTQAQKEAGNYQKGHINLHGLDIAIENPQGSERRGVSPDGKEWSSTLASHYGYFKRTNGNDGDHVDTFIGPNPDSTKVFVVDQLNKDGSFDEHKVMLGFDSIEEADRGYHANYEPGWTGRGAITEVPLPAFKSWVRDGKKKEPIGEIQTQAQGEIPAATDQKTDVAGSNAEGRETIATGTGSGSGALETAGVAQNLHPVAARIQRLHDAGETEVAELMQREHDRDQRLNSAPTELAAMQEVAPDLSFTQIPEFQQTYMQLRGSGAKPAEAAARAGILATVQSQGPAAGLSVKAIAALNAQLEILPLEKAPAFAQRFTEALIEKGGIAPFEGSDRIGSMLEQARDGAMHAMADAAYRENAA